LVGGIVQSSVSELMGGMIQCSFALHLSAV
jgi:hypothetical protein